MKAKMRVKRRFPGGGYETTTFDYGGVLKRVLNTIKRYPCAGGGGENYA